MSLSAFNALAFQRKVDDALRVVSRTLELERHPRLASEVDHNYGAKFGLVNTTSNAAVIAYVNALERLGLDAAALKAIDKGKAVTLRFEAETKSDFVEEKTVDVPVGRSYHETEEETKSGGDDKAEKTTKSRVMKLFRSSVKSMKAVNHITEFHWDVELKWSLSIYSGTSVNEKRIIKSRKCTTRIITQRKDAPGSKHPSFSKRPTFSAELPLTWLLGQIDLEQMNSQFRVDVEDEETKTPRRNAAVDEAINFAAELGQWSKMIEWGFVDNMLGPLRACHNPALPQPAKTTTKQLVAVKDQYPIFNPILPLMEEGGSAGGDACVEDSVECKSIVGLTSPDAEDDDDQKVLLSSQDISKLLNEHIRTLEVAASGVESNWPSADSDDILSSAEATLELLTCHLQDLSTMYTESMSYVESMLEEQLIAAIGKTLTPGDVDKFVKFHEARLLRPAPRPFSHAIRRPKHYPVGLLSIESQDGSERECIHSHSREVEAASSLKIPLSAATVLELTGQQFIHGYMNHRFGESHKSHQLVARARQFSSFILVVGNMADGCTLQPKDAIIVQNKDELLIPLLLEEIPTAKEFKDAIKSLSPEQQRFARAFRKMQLASSVFGVCIIQIKPQLEALLGLPADALDKEMKLTQDLMELFVEHQVPSDLLSYDGTSEDIATADKISNVRSNVKSVLDVINAEKAKQLKDEEAKTEMAVQKAFQRAANEEMEVLDDSVGRDPPMFGASARSKKAHGGARGGRGGMARRAEPMMAMMCASAAPVSAASLSYESAPPAMPPVPPLTGALQTQEIQMDSGSAEVTSDSATIEGQTQPPSQAEASGKAESPSASQGIDYTLMPQILDRAVEKLGDGSALRSTTIKVGDAWIRNRQENLLSGPKKQTLRAEEVKKEKNKAFDLLDALSRSGGSLPIAYSELHVIVALTHCFDKDVMRTVISDNINPIEKLECSTLLLASAVHGVPARELIADVRELQRLEGTLPQLLGTSDDSDNAGKSALLMSLGSGAVMGEC